MPNRGRQLTGKIRNRNCTQSGLTSKIFVTSLDKLLLSIELRLDVLCSDRGDDDEVQDMSDRE